VKTTLSVDPVPPRIFRFADLEVDEGRQRVLREGDEIPLPKLSFDLLLALLESAPNFLSHGQLMSRVWPGLVIGDKTVTQRVKLLRDALGDDREEPRYVTGLRGRGYRIAAPVTLVAPQPDRGAPVETYAQDVPPRKGVVSPFPRFVLLVLIVTLPLLAWWLAGNLQRQGQAEATGTTAAPDSNATEITVAVLPFRDLGGDAAELAEGLPEAVIDRLSILPEFSVIARSSSFKAATENRGARETGALLGVQYLVDGSVQREGDHLRVSAQLVDASTGTQVWADRFDRSIGDVFLVQDEISASVAGALSNRAGPPTAMRPLSTTSNISAYLSYLHGRALLDRWTLADADAAVRAFELAIELDPGFAAAYASLYDARIMATDRRCGRANPVIFRGDESECPIVGATREAQRPLIERALELDPQSGSAYFARAMWADNPDDARDADFRRGLEYDPSNGRGITAFAEFLDRSGRTAEAALMLERAIKVDPLSPRAYFWRARRNPDLDVDTLEAAMLSVLEIDPDYVPALQRYAKYRWILHGDLAQAIRLIEQALSLDPSSPWLRHTAIAMYLDIGDPDAARDLAVGDEETGSVGRILLLLQDGEVREAADAALGGLGVANGPYENWGVYDALRQHALAGGDIVQSMRFLETYTHLDDPDAKIKLENFRAVPAYAQLLLLADRPDEARALLEKCIHWIDDVHLPKFGSVYALRIKAEALQMLGDTDQALIALRESFDAKDFVQWWYTIDQDPLWLPLHEDSRFAAIAAQTRRFVEDQEQKLEAMRAQGAVPMRNAAEASVGQAP